MARRRFEMFEYRQALVRMRQGDSDRQIAAARITWAGAQQDGCVSSRLRTNGLMPVAPFPQMKRSPPLWDSPSVPV